MGRGSLGISYLGRGSCVAALVGGTHHYWFMGGARLLLTSTSSGWWGGVVLLRVRRSTASCHLFVCGVLKKVDSGTGKLGYGFTDSVH